VAALDIEGRELGMFQIDSVEAIPESDHTMLARIQVPKDLARRVAGIRIQNPQVSEPLDHYIPHLEDDIIICRCERVRAGEIRSLIRQGYRDMNEIKIVSRAGMGACGSKTCNAMIHRLFRDENVPEEEIVESTKRPLLIEVPLGIFAGVEARGAPPGRGVFRRGNEISSTQGGADSSAGDGNHG